jgi:hypothetical protein
MNSLFHFRHSRRISKMIMNWIEISTGKLWFFCGRIIGQWRKRPKHLTLGRVGQTHRSLCGQNMFYSCFYDVLSAIFCFRLVVEKTMFSIFIHHCDVLFMALRKEMLIN